MVQLSPAELLMGQAIRSNVPQVEEVFIPKWPYLEKFRQDNNRCKRRQKSDFDRSHRTRPLANIPEDTEVWIRTVNQQIPGQIAITANTPRSYIVDTQNGQQIRRNRLHITPMPRQNRSPIQTLSRTGIRINPPERL